MGEDEDGELEKVDRLRYLRALRRHADGCCCWECVTALERWIAETTSEQREAHAAEMRWRVKMAEFTLQQQIDAVKREIAFREKTFPRDVATGKMKQPDADLNIAEMRSVLKTLLWLEKNRTAVTTAVGQSNGLHATAKAD